MTDRTAVMSAQTGNVLTAAVRRAVHLDAATVGTEHLFLALADSDGPGSKLGKGTLRAQTAARGTARWADDDTGRGGPSDAVVTALLREAHHLAGREAVLPETGALRECLRDALVEAGDGVLTTTHVALALLRTPSGRVAELLTVQRTDTAALAQAVRAAARPEEAGAVALLRKTGVFEGDSGGGWQRLMTGFFTWGDHLGGPVLLLVRREAGRHAVRCGRSEASGVDLVAAVLTLDEQITAAGLRLRPQHESGGAEALRVAGVDPVALLEDDVDQVEGQVDRAWAGAKLVAARRGDDVVGTSHLLMALLDDPADPVGPALRGLGCDPAVLRTSLDR